ncbi:MAG: TolC family protein [Myxococcaceae bacterium]|nr:TolC family protein [Myxococcaceae bacterium]
MVLLALLSTVVSQAGPTLELSTLEDAAALPALVWEHAPDLQAARARVAAAGAEVQRALLLPNPGLDVSVNTLPVGPLNPPELRDPLLNVPNLAVGLSVLVELGKRGPRQDAAREAARAVSLDALEQLRQRTLTLLELLVDVAAAEVRVATLTALASDAERLVSLQRARLEKGDASALDADRARIEQQSTLTALGEARESLAEGLRACSELIGLPCRPFGDPARASDWLGRRLDLAQADPTKRPDLASLDAVAARARAEALLARRRALPDPTVRVGYVHDRFVVSGNQQNSLFVGVAMPLPVFDHGQADAAAAAAAATAAERARQKLLDSAATQHARLEAQRRSLESRLAQLRDETLPLARSVIDRLEAAVTRGAAPLPELLIARRTYSELVLTTNDLDRAFARLQVGEARVTGAGLPLPGALP